MKRCATINGPRCPGIGALAGVLALGLMVPGPAMAGKAVSHRPATVASARDHEAGRQTDLFSRITGWLNRLVSGLTDGVTDTLAVVEHVGTRTGNDIRHVATEATGNFGAMRAMPDMGLVKQRARCAVAPNGAPDCRRTAVAICRKHGFTSGRTVDIQAEEKCPVTAVLGQHKLSSAQCRTETYVLRSMCE